MNLPKVVAGVAVLVLAGFWGFILIEMLGGLGVLILLAAPFVILLAIGSYVVIDALGALSVQPRGSRAGVRLGALDLAILQMTAQRKSQQEMANTTGVSLELVGERLQRLAQAGYLFQGSLSEKGFEAARSSG